MQILHFNLHKLITIINSHSQQYKINLIQRIQ